MTRPQPKPAKSGAPFTNGLINGWSNPRSKSEGHTNSHHLSTIAFRTGSVFSDPIGSFPQKYGLIKIIPCILNLTSGSGFDPTRMARWWAMVAPALSPARKIRSKSTSFLIHSSNPDPGPDPPGAWEETHLRA
ncbi:hypothetical protein HanIR_Chr02g0063561 [Helianthus annuus]|nr:hypothetical protein HanIR_Chr02g0063561 [Helianthus annuus]